MSRASSKTLRSAALTPKKFAASLESALKDKRLQEDDAQLLRDLQQRLRKNPALLRGGNAGGFTYSDPQLASAVYAALTFADKDHSLMEARGSLEGDDLTEFWGHWVGVAVRTLTCRDSKSLQELAGRTPTRAVKFPRATVRLAVVGDAGYRGVAQKEVLRMIRRCHEMKPFDAVVHLGDVYLAAGEKEMNRHFLTPFSEIRNLNVRVFTLVGNHDLYLGGDAFLSALKILDQPGRYFKIETPHWRIVCLDTSTAAPGPRRSQGKLDGGQLEWLENVLRTRDPKGVIFMSHHFYLSAWENAGAVLRAQLQSLIPDKVFAWYWGHEHRCATYDRGEHGFYGACVGNGAFVEKWTKPDPSLIGPGFPSWYASKKCKCYPSKVNHWPHGFLELELRPDLVQETHYLERNLERPYLRTLVR